MSGRVLTILAACFVSSGAFGQGTILFDTRIPGVVNAPVYRSPPGISGAGAGVTAQLFLETGAFAYTPLFPTTTFQTTSAAMEPYVNPVVVEVPGVPAGSSAIVFMRAWNGPEYYSQITGGQSAAVIITLGGLPPGGGERIPDANLVGLSGFVIPNVPEPATVALVVMGLGILAMHRRE